MKTLYKLINTGHQCANKRIRRLRADIGQVVRVAANTYIVFYLVRKPGKVALTVTVIVGKKATKYNYRRDTFVFMGDGTGLTLLPRALSFTEGQQTRIVFDLVNIYEEKTASN